MRLDLVERKLNLLLPIHITCEVVYLFDFSVCNILKRCTTSHMEEAPRRRPSCKVHNMSVFSKYLHIGNIKRNTQSEVII